MSWEKELDEYIKSDPHLWDCAAYNEGQECCIEKSWLKEFIRRYLKKAYDTGYRNGQDEVY